HCSSRSCPRDRDSVIRAPVMIVPDRRRALIMIALYGAILGGWFAFARWVAGAMGEPGAHSAVVRLSGPDRPEGGHPGLLLLPPDVARGPAGTRSLVLRI